MCFEDIGSKSRTSVCSQATVSTDLQAPDRASDSDRALHRESGARQLAAPQGLANPRPGWASGPRAAAPGGGGSPPSEGPRLPVGRVLEVEDCPVGAGAEVHRIRGMDGTIEVSHGAEIVPRRVHKQPTAQAARSQPPEEPGARAAQARSEAGLAAAPGPAVRPGWPAWRGRRGRISFSGSG